MRRTAAAIALALLTAVTLVACGSTSSSPSSGPLPTKVIDITFNGSSVTPNGTTIDVALGQRIEFDVTADAPGEIHVHSSPQEQEFEYDKGSSTIEVKPITVPGRVVVESHTLNKTLFFLQAQ